MGFFDKMKAMVGVGSPKLALDLDPPTFAAGTLLQGSILITAQDRPTPFKSITISLIREHAAKMTDGSTMKRRETFGELVMPSGHTLGAHEAVRFPFQFMPLDMGEDIDGAAYELVAVADCPGLDPRTSLALTKVDPPEEVASSDIEALDTAGLIPVRAGFLSQLERFGADDLVWLPAYANARGDQTSYEPGQHFDADEISQDLVDQLHGRVVFLATRSNTEFGVLARLDGGLQLIFITEDIRMASGFPLSDIQGISLARFVGPGPTRLTYDTLREMGRSDAAFGRSFDDVAFEEHIASLPLPA